MAWPAKTAPKGTTKGKCKKGAAKEDWTEWVTANGENNRTKGELTNGKELTDAATILWGENSSKPSLRDTGITSNVDEWKVVGMGVLFRRGAEVCASTSWGLIIIPAGANVRAVGTEVCMIGVRAAARTFGECEEGKKGCTWSAEGYSDWRSVDVAIDVLGAISSDPLRYGFFFGEPSEDYFLDCLLLDFERGLRVALSREGAIFDSSPSVFIIPTSS